MKPIGYILLVLVLLVACNNEIDTPQISVEKNIITKFSFSTDESKQIGRTLSSSVSLTIIDDLCNNWQIDVPLQPSSSREVYIKIAPMEGIEADPEWGSAIAGLQFEPSGFIFYEPMKVTVTLEGEFENPVIFMTVDEDGNAIEIPEQEHNGNEYTIQVEHFSGVIGLVPDDIGKLCDYFNGEFTASIDEAKALLTDNPQISVNPVSFEFRCDESDNRLLSLNVVQMLEPERTAIKNLLQNQYGTAYACNNMSEPPEIVTELSDQLVKKALSAIDEYINQPEKFAALTNFALIAGKWNSTLGSPNALSNNKKLTDACIDMAKKNLDYFRKKIIEEHDYTYFASIVSTYSDICIMDGVDNMNEKLTELENLFRFEMELEIGVYRNSTEETVSSVVKGEIPLVLDTHYQRERGTNPLHRYSLSFEGEGTVSASGSATLNHDDGTTSKAKNTTGEFTREMEVDLNLCEFTGTFLCPYPYLHISESWEGDEFYVWILEFQNFANLNYGTLVSEKHGQVSMPVEFRFQNRQKVLIDNQEIILKSIDGSNLKVEVNYKITHAPK